MGELYSFNVQTGVGVRRVLKDRPSAAQTWKKERKEESLMEKEEEAFSSAGKIIRIIPYSLCLSASAPSK